MIKILISCLKLVSKRNKRNTYLMLIGNQIGSILEVVGLGLIPILALNILNKDKILLFLKEKNMEFFSSYINMDNFIFYSFGILIGFFIFKNFFLFIMGYFQAKLRISIFNDLSNRFFQLYIHSPYQYFLKKNPSYLTSIMTNEVHGACTVLELLILLIRDFFSVIIISIVLILIDPKISLFLIIFIFLLVLIFNRLIKKFISLKGKILQESRADNIKLINQSFEIIKEAKILKKESFFVNLFSAQLKLMGKLKLTSAIIGFIPRPILEIIVLIVIALVLFYASFVNNNLNTAIPFVSFFAISSIRLIPAFKNISTSLTNINFNKISIDIITKEMEEISNNQKFFSESIQNNDVITKKSGELKKFEIKKVNFKYNKNIDVLKNISLEINNGEKIGIIGPSGSGKSTLINLILGLLKPSDGQILVNKNDIYQNLNYWHNLIGYIPQEIYLLNESIKSNIALGQKESEISTFLIDEAIRKSNSKEFIDHLPDGINTNVGNRGISFSGGQKQRLGIARALYRQPKVLILDEATNSLDAENEKAINSHILNLKDITVIIVAHNVSTLSNCDKLVLMDNGSIKDIGSFLDITQKYNLV
jgi:ABC-type multidrug transport system fused ATPase/permease subunit